MRKTRVATRESNVYFRTVLWSLITTLTVAFLLQLTHSAFKPLESLIFFRLIFFEDRFALWMAGGILIAAVALAPRVPLSLVERVLAAVDRHIVALSVASFFVFGLGSLLFYHRHPLSMDEFSIVYQSRVFATGKLDGQVPPGLIDRIVAPQFIIEFFGIDRPRGLITSVYWPGTSLLMVPFTMLNAPWLFNPFISALSIFCLHRATREITGSPKVAAWTMLFTLCSSVVAVSAASFYAMPSHMLANILFAWSLFHADALREKGRETKHKSFVLIAGMVGGFALVLHNPVPHLAFAAPWLLWVVSKRREWILPLVAGYLVFALPLGVGWFWHLKTLNAQMPAMEGSVLARLPRIFVLPSLQVAFIRLLAVFKIMAWAVPGMLVLCAISWRQARNNLWLRLLTSSLATLFFAYCFISYPQGHGWGYRFIHPAWFVFPLLAALALDRCVDARGEVVSTSQCTLTRQFFAVALGLSLCLLLPFQALQVHKLIRYQLAQVPSPPTAQKSMLFINPRVGYYTSDLVQNDPFLRGLSWKLIARDPASDEALAKQFLQAPVTIQKGPWGELMIEKP